MGNHSAGRAMGLAAEQAIKTWDGTQAHALKLLDEICEPWRGCDAEFEAEDPNRRGRTHPDYIFHTDVNAPLGKLMLAAFAPGQTYEFFGPPGDNGIRDEREDEVERWYTEVDQPFSKRYHFT